MKYVALIYILLLALPVSLFGQKVGCKNGDFEQGNFANWSANGQCNGAFICGCPCLSLVGSNIVASRGACNATPGFVNNPVSGQHQYTIQNAGSFDPILTGCSPIYTLPTVPTTGGNFSARLGNECNGYAMEIMSRQVVVDALNPYLFFKYAVVMNPSHSCSSGDFRGDEVFFLARILDSGGSPIPGARVEEIGNPNNGFIQQTTESGSPLDTVCRRQRNGTMYFRDWRCVRLDLRGYENQTVTVEFINSDCGASGHMGYSYVDDVCMECDPTEEEPTVDITAITDTCVGLDQFIQGNFTLPVQGPSTGTFVSLDLLVYQNGLPINTVNVSSFVTGTNFAIPLDPAYFPGNPGDCFDVFVQGTFTLVNPYSGQVQTLVENSAPLALGEGATSGLNNDVCICSKECCEEVYFFPSATGTQLFPNLGSPAFTSLFYMDVNLVAGPNLLTEVSAFIEDFHYTYNHEDCNNCFNPPMNWGSIAITDPVATGGIWDAYTNTGLVNSYPYFANPDVNIREVVWQDLASPRDFTSGVPIRWYMLLPTLPEIPCCVLTIDICITFTITDVDCNVCEYTYCGELVSYDPQNSSAQLRNQENALPFNFEKLETQEVRPMNEKEMQEVEQIFQGRILGRKE